MLKKWFDHVSSHVTVWTWVYGTGVVGGGTISALIARATSWIEPWGPIGWWAAAMLGALIGALVLALASYSYSFFVDARLRKRIYGPNDRVNPRENNFRNQRIKITDLALPLDPFIREKSFDNCDLIGPCNLILKGRGEITNCNCSYVEAAIIRSDKNATVINAIALESCIIRNCYLYQVTMLVPVESFVTFRDGMKGMSWITEVPTKDPLA